MRVRQIEPGVDPTLSTERFSDGGQNRVRLASLEELDRRPSTWRPINDSRLAETLVAAHRYAERATNPRYLAWRGTTAPGDHARLTGRSPESLAVYVDHAQAEVGVCEDAPPLPPWLERDTGKARERLASQAEGSSRWCRERLDRALLRLPGVVVDYLASSGVQVRLVDKPLEVDTAGPLLSRLLGPAAGMWRTQCRRMKEFETFEPWSQQVSVELDRRMSARANETLIVRGLAYAIDYSMGRDGRPSSDSEGWRSITARALSSARPPPVTKPADFLAGCITTYLDHHVTDDSTNAVVTRGDLRTHRQEAYAHVEEMLASIVQNPRPRQGAHEAMRAEVQQRWERVVHLPSVRTWFDLAYAELRLARITEDEAALRRAKLYALVCERTRKRQGSGELPRGVFPNMTLVLIEGVEFVASRSTFTPRRWHKAPSTLSKRSFRW